MANSEMQGEAFSLNCQSQLETSESVLKTTIALRNLVISQESKFDFDLPKGCKEWPGPKFGAEPPHAQHSNGSKQSSSKRQHSQSPLGKRAKAPKAKGTAKPKANGQKSPHASKQLTDYGLHTKRDPPLCFLSLPGELRNLITNTLIVYDEPIKAHFRPVLKFCGRRRSTMKLIRRYPPEPALAQVNHQLRQEVLSTFYGVNQFIFQKNPGVIPDACRITKPDMLALWNRGDPARYIRHIEIRLEAYPSVVDPTVLNYTLRSLPNGHFSIDFSFHCIAEYCTCMEDEVIKETFEAIGEKPFGAGNSCIGAGLNALSSKPKQSPKRELVLVAADILTKRKTKLESLAYRTGYGVYYVPRSMCEICRKKAFDEIHDG